MGADASNGLSSLLRGGGVERGRNSSFSNETFESKKDGYSANSYRAVPEDLVLPNDTAGLIFMQDNAPIRTAQKVTVWLEVTGIRVTD